MSKPRVVKDYDKVPDEVLALIKLEYPYGFDRKLILFKNAKGKFVSALPFETEDRYYLIRMTATEAQEIIEEDDDFDDDGNLTEKAKVRLEDEIEEIEGENDKIGKESDDD